MAASLDVHNTTQQEKFNALCAQARDALVVAERGDVPARYKVSVIAKRARNTAEYGPDGLLRMDAALGLAPSTLYAYAKVSDVWGPEEFPNVSGKVNAKGMALSWSHWTMLATIGDDGTRQSVLEQTLRESLNIRQLRVAKRGDRSADDASRVQPADGRAPGSEVRGKLSRLLASMAKEARAVEECVLPMIAAGNPKLSDSELSEYRATLKGIGAAEGILGGLKAQLLKITGEVPVAPTDRPAPATKQNRGKRRGTTDAPDQVELRT